MEKTDKPDAKLLRKLFRGAIKEDELKKLNEWYHSFDNDQELDVASRSNESAEEVKKRVFSSILARITVASYKKSNIFRLTRTYWKVAAAIAFCLLLARGAFLIFDSLSEHAENIAWEEKVTGMGEKWIVTYQEGSRVILNAGSQLRYPRSFAHDAREVYLQGEAYFEVAPDSSRPFIVHSGHISTTVLGTVFNVKAFPDENAVVVSLLEGHVSVSRESVDKESPSVLLQPLRQLVYEKSNRTIAVEDVDIQRAVGWKDNNLKFDKEPLKDIFVVLERAYAVKFELSDSAYGTRKISANFNQASLWTVAEVIKRITGLKYRKVVENNTVKKILFYK
jgi:transmembrane sensor